MKKLWISFAAVFTLSFAILGWIGTRIHQEMPPIPAKVVSTDGSTVVAEGDVGRGQNVWQSLGGMEVGSIWGHGGYVAPDWTADWLHREASFVLDDWARAERGQAYDQLPGEEKARLQGRLQEMYRRNTWDPKANTMVIDPVRARFRSLPAPLLARVHAWRAEVRDSGRQREHFGTDAPIRRIHVLDRVVGRRNARATTSLTRITGRTSHWSATGRPAKR